MSIGTVGRSCTVAAILIFSTCGAALASNEEPGATLRVAVDSIFADLEKFGSPGCALGVYRNGQIIYAKGYGLANIEQHVAITPKSVFDIASNSKQFSATSILLLEQRGKLSINDDVHKYIPELPDYGRPITILQLLNHTSGLRDYLSVMEYAGINTDSVTTDEDALAVIQRQKTLDFAPGSEHVYSNTGFFLLSVIIKRVTGKTLREFAAENIFRPLGMNHTEYRDDHTELVAERALAYEPKENGSGFTLAISYFEQTGDGGVMISVEDLQKWDENFYSGQIGGKELLAKIQERGILNSGKVLEYAKGLYLQQYRGLRTVRHSGSWGGYRSELLRFPEQHFSVACLCNRGDSAPTRRAEQVADIYLSKFMNPAEKQHDEAKKTSKMEITTIPVSARQLQDYEGKYWSDEVGATYQLGVVEGKLQVVAVRDLAGYPRINVLQGKIFQPTAAEEFRLQKSESTLRFTRNEKQLITGFQLSDGEIKGFRFERVPNAKP
jgi:CubicO group peptidase (beta-lactamase class C family)